MRQMHRYSYRPELHLENQSWRMRSWSISELKYSEQHLTKRLPFYVCIACVINSILIRIVWDSMNSFIEDTKFQWCETPGWKSHDCSMVETDTNPGFSCCKAFILSRKAVFPSDALPFKEWAKHIFLPINYITNECIYTAIFYRLASLLWKF